VSVPNERVGRLEQPGERSMALYYLYFIEWSYQTQSPTITGLGTGSDTQLNCSIGWQVSGLCCEQCASVPGKDAYNVTVARDVSQK